MLKVQAESLQTIRNLLFQHIQQNIIQSANTTNTNNKTQLLKQKTGIPQGSILSSQLCALFFGQVDRILGFMRFFAGHVLLRYVDDFLFVATNAVAVKAFVDSMRTQAAILFGCRINEAKTRSNVPEVLMDDGSKDGSIVLKDEMIRWCGFCISSKDLQVTADNSSYGAIEISTSHGTSQVNTKKDTKNHSTRSTDSVVSVCSVPSRACCHPIADSMTIDYSAPWGQQLQQRLLRLLKNRLQLLLLDSRINSTTTVIGNILTAFQLTASRCWLHCKVSNPAFLNNDFLFDACCRRMALSCASWLRSKRQDRSNNTNGSVSKPSIGSK